MTRRKKVFFIIGIPVGLACAFMIVSINWERWLMRTTIEPKTVVAGDAFTLSTTFYAQPPKIPNASRALSVTGTTKQDIGYEYDAFNDSIGLSRKFFLDDQTIESEIQARDAIGTALSTRSGVMRKALYDQFLAYSRGEASYVISDIGCPLVQGQGYTDRWKWSSTVSEEYVVLPATPEGSYTVTYADDYYCGLGGLGRIPTFTLVVTSE